MKSDGEQHAWRFVRLGGMDQVGLESADDLRALPRLDQKLWVALACPTRGIELDRRSLDLLDLDNDGRIRAPEVIEAVRWICKVLRDPAHIKLLSSAMPLDQINESDDEGRALLASARRILADLGKPDAAEISIEDVSGAAKRFAETRFNGDGIVPPAAASEDASLRSAIEDIIACVGSELDGSGAPGLSAALLDKFVAEAEALSNWWKQAEDDPRAILPLSEGSSAAAGLLDELRPKVADYFMRCRLAAFDPRAAEALNRSIDEYKELARRDFSATLDELAAFPLARVEAGRPLPLASGVNPAWSADVDNLRRTVVRPLLGDIAEIDEAQWSALLGRFDGFRSWLGRRAGAAVEKLGVDRVRAILAGQFAGQIRGLIASDEAARPEAAAIQGVERLVHYNRDLYRLLNNFVAFHDLYSQRRAVFQVGTLYLDGRSCELCLQVEDVARHANMSVLSNIHLAYCLCKRPGSSETMHIVAGFTAGDSDFLAVGRNGLFYDHQGRDWDASIVKIIENPISRRQAFFSPYKKAARFIGDQLVKFGSSREKAVQDQMGAHVTTAGQTAAAGKPPEGAPQFDIARFSGIFAAIGLAVGAIGTALVAVFSGFFGLRWWQMPLALIGLVLAISGPSMLLAWLKLRQRNLASLLEAGGWAVNAPVRISIPFGTSLTEVAKLPPQAKLSMLDPYAPKKHRLLRWLLVLLILLGLAVLGVVFYDNGVLLNYLLKR